MILIKLKVVKLQDWLKKVMTNIIFCRLYSILELVMYSNFLIPYGLILCNDNMFGRKM